MTAYFPHRKAGLSRETRSGLEHLCELARALLRVERAFVSLLSADGERLAAEADEQPGMQRELAFTVTLTLEHDGQALGVLGVAGRARGELTELERNALGHLSAMAVDHLRGREERIELQQQSALLRQTERLAQTGGWIVDFERNTALWSQELYRLHEADPNEPVTFESLKEFYPNGHAERLDSAFQQAIVTGKGFEMDLEYRTRTGRTKWARILGEVELRPGLMPRVLGTFRDLTAQHEAETGLRNAAFHDSITGLFNRKRLDVRLDELCQGGEGGALVLVGLDNFKALNEARGRNVGDAFLRNVGERLVTKLNSDSFLARIGGDEFAVLLPGVHDSNGILRHLPAIQAALDAAYSSEPDRLVVSSSLGVATFPGDSTTAAGVQQAAEMALRQAKALGGDRIEYFAPRMRDVVEGKIALLDDVRRGLAAHEFVLHYQPICTPEGRVRGFEALMRWDHSSLGLVGPSHFMAAFEEPDLSITLGLVALRDAIEQMRSWTATGLAFEYVAVNLSGAQLAEDDLADVVASLLRSNGVEPRRLMLEVTESVYLDGNSERISKTLHALRALGVSFALDDFGTGYASLSHLKALAVDRIKIDRSFVQEIGNSKNDAAIVRAIISLGQALDLEVVAEGVETAVQLSYLQELGCGLIQGYYFARPMPPAQAASFCEATTGNSAPLAS